MSHQDWRSVDIGRKSGGSLTSQEILLKKQTAQRKGQSVSYQKNSLNFKNIPPNSRKLDDATESSKIIKLKEGKNIMQGRIANKLSRKQLACKLNMKEEELAKFENNNVHATPANKILLTKIKRILKIK
uniref:HTH cro/C1-type domain-containing protein n=1 Tax=viral metagenome TaxID=1070528 RepID=A0A6C0L1G8_9ZZZZ|tara:strand:+ start:5629 stop:6015 length:387 start_codon:yes stop_codon:yes gene_type:complete